MYGQVAYLMLAVQVSAGQVMVHRPGHWGGATDAGQRQARTTLELLAHQATARGSEAGTAPVGLCRVRTNILGSGDGLPSYCSHSTETPNRLDHGGWKPSFPKQYFSAFC